MKRPAKEEVLAAMRPVVRWNYGSNRLVEAVELRSGILVVEYIYQPKITSAEGRHRYIRSIAVKPWWSRPPLTHVVETGYINEGEQPNE